jgi:hypothetical protein
MEHAPSPDNLPKPHRDGKVKNVTHKPHCQHHKYLVIVVKIVLFMAET